MFISTCRRMFKFKCESFEPISSSLLVAVLWPILSFIPYAYTYYMRGVFTDSVSLAFFFWAKYGSIAHRLFLTFPSILAIIWTRYLALLHIPLLKWSQSIVECLWFDGCLKPFLCKLNLWFNLCTFLLTIRNEHLL